MQGIGQYHEEMKKKTAQRDKKIVELKKSQPDLTHEQIGKLLGLSRKVVGVALQKNKGL